MVAVLAADSSEHSKLPTLLNWDLFLAYLRKQNINIHKSSMNRTLSSINPALITHIFLQGKKYKPNNHVHSVSILSF